MRNVNFELDVDEIWTGLKKHKNGWMDELGRRDASWLKDYR